MKPQKLAQMSTCINQLNAQRVDIIFSIHNKNTCVTEIQKEKNNKSSLASSAYISLLVSDKRRDLKYTRNQALTKYYEPANYPALWAFIEDDAYIRRI